MSDDTARVPPDEELAKTLYIAYCGEDFGDFQHLLPGTQRKFDAMARSAREALYPPVPPLAPGEVVTIPDCVMRADHLSAEWSVDGRRLYLLPVLDGDDDDSDRGMNALDAAGIAALETVCRRARVALEGGK